MRRLRLSKLRCLQRPRRPPTSSLKKPTLTLEDLLHKAGEYGIAEVYLGKAAARYCRGKRLDQLDAAEIASLYNRLVASREGGSDTSEMGHEGSQKATAPAVHTEPNGAASSSHTDSHDDNGTAPDGVIHGDTDGTSPVRAAIASRQSNGRVRS